MYKGKRRMELKLVDMACNLTHPSFYTDLRQVLQRAWEAGVCAMVVPGSNITDSRDSVAMCQQYPGLLYPTVGVHPHYAKSWNAESRGLLGSLVDTGEVVGIGECGLDYYRDFSPRGTQREVFAEQLALAIEMRLPVLAHERDAGQDFLGVLREYGPHLRNIVVHCFTGDKSMLENYLDAGCYIGITGWLCDERRGRHLEALMDYIPLDRLMVETDAPFLFPRSLRHTTKNRRNEPCFLVHIAEKIAQCRTLEVESISFATWHASHTFFGLSQTHDIGVVKNL